MSDQSKKQQQPVHTSRKSSTISDHLNAAHACQIKAKSNSNQCTPPASPPPLSDHFNAAHVCQIIAKSNSDQYTSRKSSTIF
jgi:hypothetical protein